MAPGVTRRQFSRKLSPRWRNPHILLKRIRSPKDTVELELDNAGLKSGSAPPELAFSCFKAAWILTLQCFQPTDVISLNYDDGLQTVYTIRVNPEWDLQTFLQLIQDAEWTKDANAQSYGVGISREPSILNSCTASLRYFDQPQGKIKQPSTSDDTKSKVILFLIPKEYIF